MKIEFEYTDELRGLVSEYVSGSMQSAAEGGSNAAEIAAIRIGKYFLDLIGARGSYCPPRQERPPKIPTEQQRRVPNKLRLEVFKRDGFACKKCGSDQELVVDHILPHSKGGLTVLENLQPLCWTCNGAKGNRTGL